jgi:hypothetical protein
MIRLDGKSAFELLINDGYLESSHLGTMPQFS